MEEPGAPASALGGPVGLSLRAADRCKRPDALVMQRFGAGTEYGLAFTRMSAKNQGAHNSIK